MCMHIVIIVYFLCNYSSTLKVLYIQTLIDTHFNLFSVGNHVGIQHTCVVCEDTFAKLSQLLKHRRTENHWPQYGCPSCKKTFTRKDNLDIHMKKHADENNHHCPECLRVFTRKDALDEHFI